MKTNKTNNNKKCQKIETTLPMKMSKGKSKDALVFLDESVINNLDFGKQYNFFADGNQIGITQEVSNIFDTNLDNFMDRNKELLTTTTDPEYNLLRGTVDNAPSAWRIEHYHSDKIHQIIDTLAASIKKNILDALFSILNNGTLKFLYMNSEQDEDSLNVVNDTSVDLYELISNISYGGGICKDYMFNNLFRTYINTKCVDLFIGTFIDIENSIITNTASLLYDFFRKTIYNGVSEYNDRCWINVQDYLYRDIMQFKTILSFIVSTKIVECVCILDAIAMEKKLVVKDNRSYDDECDY